MPLVDKINALRTIVDGHTASTLTEAVSTAKTDIAAAIADKSVEVPEGTTLDGMAALISQIPSGSTDTEDAIVQRTVTSYSNDRVKKIGTSAFDSCSRLTTIDLPAATSIGYGAFGDCTRLTSVNLPTATTIDTGAFRSCTSLTTIDLPAAISISATVFDSCTSLISVNLPVATSIWFEVFSGCISLTNVNLPVATSIGSSAFDSCANLTSIDLPAATSIGSSAFDSCANLTSIDLPAATSIGGYAFYSCSALITICLRNASKVCTYSTSSSSGDPSNTNLKIYVPAALLESYKTATNWSRLADHFVALEDYTVDGTTTGAMNTDDDGNIVART